MFKTFKTPLRLEGSPHNAGVTYVIGADGVELFRAYSARPELEEMVAAVNAAPGLTLEHAFLTALAPKLVESAEA